MQWDKVGSQTNEAKYNNGNNPKWKIQIRGCYNTENTIDIE